MTLLSDLVAAIGAGTIEIYDLTAPVSSTTPILALPEQFGQTWKFGVSIGCAKWLAEEVPIQGVGVETVGTDAGSGSPARVLALVER